MSRINCITYPDLNNGPGCRVSVFFQGCPIHCPGCFNSELWDFNGGHELAYDKIMMIHEILLKPYIRGLSILGGEPLAKQNMFDTMLLCNMAKGIDGKDTWVYTGYKYEDLNEDQLDSLQNADVLVDGPFKKDLADRDLVFKGSSNQRIIDLNKTRSTGNLVLLDM